ncbi:MAG: SMC family ATPase [Dialister sp.]|nr:SMC family ATPase [Dialister sp.]
MKPLKLTMTAFGPYAGRTTIDFSALHGRNLFLICGATGSGKTTILDAMCYALYGKTTGDRTGADMRSDYAPSSVRTEVIFEFSLGNKTYRATRAPEQYVDKKRGSGQTQAAMQASLAELEEGKEISSIRTGVEEAAADLIGLNANQFCQVILLPQGDFRKLLVAKPDEREEILKKLFKTQRFSDFQEELKNRWNALEAKRQDEETERLALLRAAGADDRDALLQEMKSLGGTAAVKEAQKKELEVRAAAFKEELTKAAALAAHYESMERARARRDLRLKDKAGMDKKEDELSRIRKASGLQAYFERLESLLAQGKQLRKEADEAKATRNTYAEDEKKMAALMEAITKEEPLREKDRDTVTKLAELEPMVDQYGAAQEDFRRYSKAYEATAAEYKKLEDKTEVCRKQSEALEKEAVRVREEYVKAQAAVLAESLSEGMPCPVCGATHHPMPAVAEGNFMDKAMLDKAEAAAASARYDWDNARNRKDAYNAGILADALRKYSTAKGVLEQAEAFMAKVPEELREKEALLKRINDLNAEIQDFTKRKKKAEADREDNAKRLSVAETEAASLQKQLLAARGEYIKAEEALNQRAKEAGFADKNDCERWIRETGDMERMDKEIREYRTEISGLERMIVDESIAVKGTKRPDMDSLAKREAAMEEERKILVQVLSDVESRRTSLARIDKALAELETVHGHTMKDSGLVKGLYDLTRGDKSRITLERFVLGALLDEVTGAANSRLRTMTGHRFSLHRMKETEKIGKGGLTLEVSDSYTGKSRPANTLSGGETFQASLSLALGLSDVVQAKQGGIRLDTMFIDEGFGTLDPEALNSAMNTLIDLQSSGRLVGIISHVQELEERIDARLRITAGEKGSVSRFEVVD